ncbi:MAG TPA: hypothetical protein VE263_22350 [Candidatus Angelobacter sp.]|nr:hypothetical protein [Candidatus Angelobacter sp.]
MSTKDKLLLIWLLMIVALSFFISHFWSFTIYAIQKAVALGVVPLLVASRLAGIHYFP